MTLCIQIRQYMRQTGLTAHIAGFRGKFFDAAHSLDKARPVAK
jgi:hypothetical protein